MWESRGADEPITSNFSSIVFYEEKLLRRVYAEIGAFLATPAETLLAAGLPLKLGFLFHGPPGTGKTHLVRHLAAKFGLDIDIIDMNSGNMNNASLMQSVNMASGIILLEDIDNVDAACGVKLPGDKDSRKVTLDGLLNALDGVQRGASKRIIVATTNYPEKLMPSLRRRGRLGLSFQIDYPSDATMARLITYSLPTVDAVAAVASVRAVERRIGLPAPTAALTDVFAKAGLRVAHSGHTATAQCAEAIVQVEEVLDEVASTNKKVFRHVGELLTFLNLADELTSGEVAASQTLLWEQCDISALPSRAKELIHDGLAAALASHAAGAGAAAKDQAKAETDSEAKGEAGEAKREAKGEAGGEPLGKAKGEVGERKSRITFTEDEWKALGVAKLRYDHYVRVGEALFMPIETGEEQARPKTYAEAFKAAACTDVKICKHLDEHKLSNDLRIAKVGHRMMLLEQFKFL